MHQRFGFPDVPLSKWRCTQARVAANGGPLSLAGAATALGLPVQKDSTGASLIAKLCKPNKKGEWTQSTTDSIDMYSYCMRDVEVEHMIRANTNPPIPSEIKLWQIDQQMNDTGIYVDKKLAENLLKLVEKEQPRIAQKVLSITGGEIDSYTKVAAIKSWCLEEHGYVINSLNAEAGQALIDNPNTPQGVRDIVTARLQGAKASTAKFVKLLECVMEDLRIRGTLQFHGAHTGRWAGRLFQTQNLPRKTLKPEVVDELKADIEDNPIEDIIDKYGEPMEVASQCIRGTIIAPPDHQMLVADYGQVESRGLAWLAGEAGDLEVYRKNDAGQGCDIYQNAYALAFKIQAKDVTDNQRQIGKTMVLAFGYGGGVNAWAKLANKESKTIPENKVSELIKRWRSTHSHIVDLWKNLELAATNAILNPKSTYRCQVVDFFTEKGTLVCVLPSGRRLVYRDAHMRNGQIHFMGAYKENWVLKNTYGGKLTENIVSAICRDLMGHAMISVQADYQIVLTVHDEIVTYIHNDRCHKNIVSEFEKAITVLPTWAEGFPLIAEGWVGKRYRK